MDRIQHPSDTISAQLRRRRQASHSMRRLRCGCRDPWTCRCYDDDIPLSDIQIQAAINTARHFLHLGLLPLFDTKTLRALWQAGYSELAEVLAR
jgi:hypothetical protein